VTPDQVYDYAEIVDAVLAAIPAGGVVLFLLFGVALWIRYGFLAVRDYFRARSKRIQAFHVHQWSQGTSRGARTMSSIAQAIITAAGQYGVDPELAIAVATQESGPWWQNNEPIPNSPAGAIGIFQLMPATAAQLGVDPTDPTQNIQGGVRYLAQLLAQFGDPVEAVAAYDWGPGNVSSAISNYGPLWIAHAPAETQNYLNAVFGAGVTSAPAAAAAAPVTAPQMVPTPGAPIMFPMQSAQAVTPGQTDITPIAIAVAVAAGLWILLEAA
jgi:hypothetical protein